MPDSLNKNIISTIVYYDILDFPLTSFEIWKHLISYNTRRVARNNNEKECSLYEVVATLDSEELKKYIEEFRGFYFLKGRKELVEARIARNKISQAKFKIICEVASWLKYAPFIRMVAVTGRVAMKNSGAQSDLDFLIAIRHGRIFTGRFFVTLISQILAKRRHGKKITNRACLNYYVSDNNPEINMKDFFSSSEYSFIFPIYNFLMFQKFQQKNLWIKNYRPNFEPDTISNPKIIHDNFLSRNSRKIAEIILDFGFLEKLMKKWQRGRIIKDPRTYKQGSAVNASDDNLIFLPDPQGPKIYEKYKVKLAEIGIK